MSAAAGNEARNEDRLILPASPNHTALPAAQLSRIALQLAVLPVLVFGFAEAVALLGASLLRTAPQGSAGALASGIFFSESL